MGRQPCCDKVGLKKGPWTTEEDKKLISFILTNGHCCWRAVPKLAGFDSFFFSFLLFFFFFFNKKKLYMSTSFFRVRDQICMLSLTFFSFVLMQHLMMTMNQTKSLIKKHYFHLYICVFFINFVKFFVAQDYLGVARAVD